MLFSNLGLYLLDLKVSIIIPVFNGSDYLGVAIESALSQTYQNIEIIVVNDGSSDNGATRKIAEKYQDRIIYIEQNNGGVSTALNHGIRISTGSYISWLSHDDLYDKLKTQKQIEFAIKLNDPKAIIFCDVGYIDAEGQYLYGVKHHDIPRPKQKLEIMLRSPLHGCAMLIPKTAFIDSGHFDINLKVAQDYDQWFKFLANNYYYKHLPGELLLSRIHRNQGSRLYSTKIYLESDLIYSKYFDLFQTELLPDINEVCLSLVRPKGLIKTSFKALKVAMRNNSLGDSSLLIIKFLILMLINFGRKAIAITRSLLFRLINHVELKITKLKSTR